MSIDRKFKVGMLIRFKPDYMPINRQPDDINNGVCLIVEDYYSPKTIFERIRYIKLLREDGTLIEVPYSACWAWEIVI